MQPARVLAAAVFVLLVTVEFGGWSLLRLLSGGGDLTSFEEQFFRAGHGHAGTLLVLSLVYFVFLERSGFSTGTQWGLGVLLLVGILAQSGGFFLHMVVGEPSRSSVGTAVTTLGGLAIAVALVTLAAGLVRRPPSPGAQISGP